MKTLRNLFLPSQFLNVAHKLINLECGHDAISKTAQQILNQFIEENGVKVWGIELAEQHKTMNTYRQPSDTHSAILLDIQPLKECEHKEAVYVEDLNGTWFKCRDCGKPVKAKGWETL